MWKSLVFVALWATTSIAEPQLPDVSPKPVGRGPAVELHATKLPISQLMKLVYDGNFVMLSGKGAFEGRIAKAVPLDAVVGAIGAREAFVVPGPGPAATVDLDFDQAPVADLLRVCADVVRADLIYAPSKLPPAITLRARKVDARNLARVVAKLAGLELVERGSSWIVVDKGTVLDPKLLAKTVPGDVRLRAIGATPGELEQLIDPAAPPGKCPQDRTIDASVRGGKIGPVLAVAATIAGPACVPSAGSAKDRVLTGVLRGPKDKRVVFRTATGTQLVTPGAGDEVGEAYVQLGTDTYRLSRSEMQVDPLAPERTPPAGARVVGDTSPCGADADVRGYVLRATAKVGKEWRALLVTSTGFGWVERERAGKVAITAGRLTCTSGTSYVLTSP